MKKFGLPLIGAFCAFALPTASLAQNQSTPDLDSDEKSTQQSVEPCVIELFVAKRYGVSGTTGFFDSLLGTQGIVGGLASEALNKNANDERKTELMQVLSSDFIKSTFLETDITSRLKADSVQVNYNILTDDRKKINSILKSDERLTKSGSECYLEIYLRNIELQRHITQSQLMVLFSLKDFRDQAAAKAKSNSINVATSDFPAKDPSKKSEVEARVRSSFRTAVEKFLQKRIN
jgi:hypothetical protein